MHQQTQIPNQNPIQHSIKHHSKNANQMMKKSIKIYQNLLSLFVPLVGFCCICLILTGCLHKQASTPKQTSPSTHATQGSQALQTPQDKIIQEYDYEQDFKKSRKGVFRVALLIPKQLVGRYSVNISNTILAYLIARGIDYEFEMFDCIDESASNLKKHYGRISDAHLVIAILSQQGVENLIESTRISYPTYVPTINKERVTKSTPSKLYFGGISYQEQLEMLIPLMQDSRQDSKIVEYGDENQIGSYLTNLFNSYNLKPTRQRTITNQDASNFTKMLPQEAPYFGGANLVLNTSASKSGLLLSQISYAKNAPKQFLSTQINFNPTILQLSTPRSRRNFFVVNAIGNADTRLKEYATLLNSDLQYDWVSYATCIGVEFGLSLHERSFKRYFEEQIQSNQVQYKNRIFTTNESAFIPVK